MATCAIDFDKSRATAGPIQRGTAAEEVRLFVDPDQMRMTEYTVYLHTISKRSFEQPHPIYRNVVIPACPKDKRYTTFFRIQHPIPIPLVNPDNVSGPPMFKFENARRAALDICNPNYRGTDLNIQDTEVPADGQLASSESNLTRQGVFASLNEIPTEEELKKAEARRFAYYKQKFEEANGIQRSNPRKLQEVLGLDHHMAAEMFGVDVDWHRVVSPKVECPQCGEKIKEGIAFHHVNGVLCIPEASPAGWERAWLAGAVRKDDVPEPMRWWNDEQPKIDKRTKEYREQQKAD